VKKSFLLVLLLPILFGLCSCAMAPRTKTEPDVIFVTTPPRVVREMLKLAALGKEDILYDLGSGDGRIVIAAARDFGVKAVGLEIDPKLIDESRANAVKAAVADRTSFRQVDIFKADIHEATVVTLFLLPGVNQMLIPKLFGELQPGTRVVSHRFDMGDWKPDVSLRAYGSDVYLWCIPAKMEGDWHITIRGEKDSWQCAWRFHRTYQVVQGTDLEKKAAFKDISLYGSEIEMVVENSSVGFGSVMELNGRVKGDVMEGTAVVKGSRAAGEYVFKGVRVR
jgi:hypothetical protein